MADKYRNFSTGLQSPPRYVEAITPNDAVDLAYVTRAINVSGAGVVSVTLIDDTVTDVYIAAGIAFPIRAKRVMATGTTATGIRGLS